MSADDPLTGHHAGLPYHLELLSDPWRVTAWKRAIEAVIRPGDVVLDVGTGTGLMAVLAARAGAGRVVAVESSETASLAEEIVADNKVDHVVEVVHADLATLSPQPVDVVLADFVGRLVPDAAMRRAVRAAASWATPRTRWLPSQVSLWLAPLGDVEVAAVERWEHPLLGVELGAAGRAALATPWSLTVGPDALLGDATRAALLTPPGLSEVVEVEATLSPRAGVCRGILAWFEAELGGGVRLDTGPGRRTFWGQVLWPTPRVDLPRGTTLAVRASLYARPGGVHHDWHVHASLGEQTLLEHTARDGAAHTARWTPAPPIEPSTRARLAAPERLADGLPTSREALGALIADLYRLGDPAVATLLATYERRFGPHPLLRRA